MANVLVTGGAGYIGSHAAYALARAGHVPIVFDNFLYGHRDFVRWGPLVEGDVRDATALERAFAAHRCDAVMHFAALAYVGESVADPGRYYDVNVGGTRTLLDAMVRARVPAIVFSSTCATYGVPGTVPIVEEAPLAPINPYGMSKLVCERMMDDFEIAYGLRSTRLRYFNAAGCERDAAIGEDHSPETHLIPLVLDAAIGRRESISVFGTDYPTADGSPIRDYIHVSDLAAAHVAALDRLLAGGASCALNLGTGRGASVREVIEVARRVTGRRIRSVDAPRRPGDPPELVADATAARRTLGWVPRHSSLEAIVADAWRWHRHRFESAVVVGK